jgi:hypothetical protein
VIWSDFIGKHKRETCYVVGLGDSRYAFIEGPAETVISVNDIGRYFTPDYLVCLDSFERFGERWENIKNSEAKTIFTQLSTKQFPIKNSERVVGIKMNQSNGVSDLKDNRFIDISYTSVFAACSIAYWMGFTTIAICGSDFTGHHLQPKTRMIVEHFREFSEAVAKKGVRVVSIVEDSPLNAVLQYIKPTEL